MKQYSIRQYVALLTLTPLLFLALSLETFFLRDRFSALDIELAERGHLIASQLASGSEYGVFSNNKIFLQNIAQGVLQQTDVQGVIVLDGASGVLVEAGKFSGLPTNAETGTNMVMPSANQTQAERFAKIKDSVSLQMPVYRSSEGLRVYHPIVPAQVEIDGLKSNTKAEQIGAVIVEMSNARTELLKLRLFWLTAGSTLLFLIFPISLIYLASRNIIYPIHKLKNAIEALGEGRLETRVTTSAHVTELVTLAHGINDMAEKLQKESVILHQRMEDAIRIAALAFESHEGMMIVGPDNVIMRVNKAFTRITSYTEDEVLGQTPHILSSGYHDTDFYSVMWNSISTTGFWQGEIWNRRKTGETYPAWVNITAVEREEGEVAYYVATYTDITERKVAENEIKTLAFNDELTHLPNRRMLIDRINQTMAASKRNGRYSALIFIDLDNFKPLNDMYGHEVGDLLLVEVANRLISCVRGMDTVARFGGDEFVVMLGELYAERDASILQSEIVVEKIRAILAEPYTLAIRKNGQVITTVTHQCTASIGVQLFVGQGASAEEVLKQADSAMYRAKREGRNAYRYYE